MSVVSGAIQPLNTIFFGDLTQNIVIYVNDSFTLKALNMSTSAADEKLKEDIRDFTIIYVCLGVAVFLSTYIATQTFNYCAIKQVSRIETEIGNFC